MEPIEILAVNGWWPRSGYRGWLRPSLKEVPRLTQGLAEFAYQDTPLPIAQGQTISQPYVVAWMTQRRR